MAENEEKDPSLIERVKTKIGQAPCVRAGLISGITGGLFLGFAAFIVTSKSIKAINWGFGGFLALSNVQYFGCKLKSLEQVRKRQN